MPITIRKQLAPFWFKLKESDPTSAAFQLQPLNQLQIYGAREHMAVSKRQITISMAGIEHVLQYGLINWQNVVDADGKEIACIRENQVQLDADILHQVAWKILMSSELNDEQKKSSS